MTRAFEASEADRRTANLMRIGTIEAVEGATATVRIGDYLSPYLPMIAVRAGGDRSWHCYEVGEQVVVLSPSGEMAAGVILGALYSDANPPPSADPHVHLNQYMDGAKIQYDRAAHHVDIDLPAGATFSINADGGLNVIGTITVTGDVIADGISLKNHKHGGVQAGAAQTGKPS